MGRHKRVHTHTHTVDPELLFLHAVAQVGGDNKGTGKESQFLNSDRRHMKIEDMCAVGGKRG